MDNLQERNARLTTPRSAALAGIVFALLFAASLTFLRPSIPNDLTRETEWIDQSRTYLTIALVVMPFAGIPFLWFIGVIRDRFGELEDRFFATVFFGSSLLFIGMVFVAMAVAGALQHPDPDKVYLGVTPPCPTREEFYSLACEVLDLPLPDFDPPTGLPPTEFDVTSLRRDLLPEPQYPDWRMGLTTPP